jgi:dihydroorotate dehydrogenase (fumarate)
MRWTAILRPQRGPDVSIAASSGVHSGRDAIKALMVGADVAMMASALLLRGPAALRAVENEMRAWLEDREYESVSQLRGSASQANIADPSSFERAQYMRTLHSWSTPPELTPTV